MDSLIAFAQVAANLAAIPLLFTIAVLEFVLGRLPWPKRKRIVPKSILITGATSGLGEALALSYAAPGTTLALTGRSGANLVYVASQCRARGATVHVKITDVTDAHALALWIREVDGLVGGLDLVIANAGISENTSGVDVVEDPEGVTRKIFDVNVTGVANTIFPALPSMRRRHSGQIAILSSLASFLPTTPYASSKAAVRTLGAWLRGQLHAEGVKVTVIMPGFVKTPMTDVNKFPMPWMMALDEAVGRIRRGLEEDRAVVWFPWQLAALVWILAIIPPTLTDLLSRHGLLSPHLSYRPAVSPNVPAPGYPVRTPMPVGGGATGSLTVPGAGAGGGFSPSSSMSDLAGPARPPQKEDSGYAYKMVMGMGASPAAPAAMPGSGIPGMPVIPGMPMSGMGGMGGMPGAYGLDDQRLRFANGW